MGLAVLVFLSKVITVYKSQLIKLVRRNNDTHRHINRKNRERERERESRGKNNNHGRT